MIKHTLEKLQSVWIGPAITVYSNHTTVKLGEGPVRATVTVNKSLSTPALLLSPSLAFGRAYMRGDIAIEGDLLAVLEGYYKTAPALYAAGSVTGTLNKLRQRSVKVKPARAIRNARHHYDLGNDFYKLWLDPTMAYTCAYFKEDSDTLEQAQRQKFDLVCRKSRLQKGQSMIDIGCGWGGLIFHAVENYDVVATGVVAAEEQGRYIIEEAKRRGLSDKVKVVVGDWREASGTYDRVISVGIAEHVGQRHYGEFLQKYRVLLHDDGVAFLHTIGRLAPGIPDAWIRKYIFPDGYLPALSELTIPAVEAGFRIYRIENLRPHYALTLAHWAKNFSLVRPEVVKMFDEKFSRMWWLYLQGSEAAFRWGSLELWQLELYGPTASVPRNRELNGAQPLKH